MVRNEIARFCICVVLAIVSPFQLGGSPKAPEDECLLTSKMSTYSNAEYIKEAGDVVGYELAVRPGKDGAINARLFVYEGAANDEGIPVSGQIADGNLAMEGDWVEHLVEQPSNKEVGEMHHVVVKGTLDPTWFRGSIKISGLATPNQVKLKRVSHIWVCGGQH